MLPRNSQAVIAQRILRRYAGDSCFQLAWASGQTGLTPVGVQLLLVVLAPRPPPPDCQASDLKDAWTCLGDLRT